MNALDALFAEPMIVAAVGARVGVAVAVGMAAVFPGVTLQIRAALAILLGSAALPLAVLHRVPQPLAPWPLLVAGEGIVGLAFGLTVAVVLSAAAWAGGIVGTAAGISWADDFDPAGDVQTAGMATLCRWLALGGFLAAGGHLAVVAGFIDGMRVLPIGAAADGGPGGGLGGLLTTLPGAALGLVVALALPALTAVLVFHAIAAICLRTIRFAPGPGVLQGLAALVLLGAVALGGEAWTAGFGSLARTRIEGSLAFPSGAEAAASGGRDPLARGR